ncbi:hypothetical protein [uncultured Dubosiella sp.]|uniref:hypothetical protein n=1 Tax=uncultured Dubosiella sp. TaxID=1937011 RepID=UPI002596EE6D|nr:hypothetical protein [uncultured Dubosiella sp.]
MKKFLKILCVFCIGFALTGCSSKEAKTEIKDGVEFELLDALQVTNDTTNTVYYYFLGSLSNNSKAAYHMSELSYKVTDQENQDVHAIARDQATNMETVPAEQSTFVYGYVGYPNNNQKNMGIYFPKNKAFLSFDSVKVRKISDKNVTYSTENKFTLYDDKSFQFDVDASKMTYDFTDGNSVVQGLTITYTNKTDKRLVVPYITPVATLKGIDLNDYKDRGDFKSMDLKQIKGVDFKTNDMAPKTEDIAGNATGYQCFYLTPKQSVTCKINFTFEHAIPDFSNYNPKAIQIDLNSAALGYSQTISVKY